MISLAALVLLAQTAAAAAPEPTKVVVRVLARDAKLLHDGVGGARITIRDEATGVVLAQGVQKGGSGDTEKIMTAPRGRNSALYDGAAAFTAELALTAPAVVTITAEGPLSAPQSMMRASKTMVLLPGEHVLGDGIVLELHGFILNVDAPASVEAGAPLPVTATLAMMCGCPITPGGLWDANTITVMATLRGANGKRLEYAGKMGTFGGTLTAPKAGTYTLEVTAASADKVNFAKLERKVVVR